MEKMTSRQRKAIWASAGKDQFDPGRLHALVFSLTRKKSLRSLTRGEASRVIESLGRKKGGGGSVSGGDFDRQDFSTKPQKFLIGKLSRELNWSRVQLQKLARRMFGITSLDALDRNQASGMIEALKAIKKRKAA